MTCDWLLLLVHGQQLALRAAICNHLEEHNNREPIKSLANDEAH